MRLARNTDPMTSHIAAVNAINFAGSHRAQIVAAIEAFGPMSARALEGYTGLTLVQIDRRVTELIKDGLLRVQQRYGEDVIDRGCRVLEIAD